MVRRDEFGWLTYPFWNVMVKVWPLRLNQGRISQWIAYQLATRAYGEHMRWQMRNMPR